MRCVDLNRKIRAQYQIDRDQKTAIINDLVNKNTICFGCFAWVTNEQQLAVKRVFQTHDDRCAVFVW